MTIPIHQIYSVSLTSSLVPTCIFFTFLSSFHLWFSSLRCLKVVLSSSSFYVFTCLSISASRVLQYDICEDLNGKRQIGHPARINSDSRRHLSQNECPQTVAVVLIIKSIQIGQFRSLVSYMRLFSFSATLSFLSLIS